MNKWYNNRNMKLDKKNIILIIIKEKLTWKASIRGITKINKSKLTKILTLLSLINLKKLIIKYNLHLF